MTTHKIAAMIAEIGVPYAYRSFTQATATAPPFVCFYFDGSSNVFADDAVVVKNETLTIELYTNQKDFDLEQKIETILNAHSLPFERQEIYIASEKLNETVYTTDVMITPADKEE